MNLTKQNKKQLEKINERIKSGTYYNPNLIPIEYFSDYRTYTKYLENNQLNILKIKKKYENKRCLDLKVKTFKSRLYNNKEVFKQSLIDENFYNYILMVINEYVHNKYDV